MSWLGQLGLIFLNRKLFKAIEVFDFAYQQSSPLTQPTASLGTVIIKIPQCCGIVHLVGYVFIATKENEIIFSSLHGYFGHKDEIKHSVWTIQITNILIGTVCLFWYRVTAAEKIVVFSAVISCSVGQAINRSNSQPSWLICDIYTLN